MARNHVWRYTLRLFHTFAIFEKNRKIDAKRIPKIVFCDENWSHVCPRINLFFHFGSFLVVRKISDFLIPNWTIKKSEKMLQDEPRSVFAVKYGSLVPARGPQGAAFSRAVTSF